MILFKIENSDKVYSYPSSWHDIKAKVFLDYVQNVVSQYPKEADELQEVNIELRSLEADIQKYEKRYDKTRFEIRDWIESGDAPKKLAAYAPEVLQRWFEASKRADELNKLMTPTWYANKYLAYIAQVVSFFTGVDYDKCIGKSDEYITLDSLQFLYNQITDLLKTEPADEQKREYLINGTTYLLPDELMKKSTLIEFAEAAQFEESMAGIKNASYSSVLEIASVLLRPLGVEYSEKQYEDNRDVFSEHLTMHDLFQVGFFLGELSKKYADALQNYMLAKAVREINS